VTEVEQDVLTHLHANPATRVDDLAAALGLPVSSVEAAVASLIDAGHVERDGDKLLPDAASHATPGLFIASERRDAESVEVDEG
jgi:DNA-binding IclR family transcriptional regulator